MLNSKREEFAKYGFSKENDLEMRIEVDDAEKIVEIWLSNSAQQAQTLDLKPFYKEYKSKGYLVAVYKSGKGDLLEQTKDLVCHNYVGQTKKARG